MISSVRSRQSLLKPDKTSILSSYAGEYFRGYLERPVVNDHSRLFMCIQDVSNPDSVAFCGDKVLDMVFVYALVDGKSSWEGSRVAVPILYLMDESDFKAWVADGKAPCDHGLWAIATMHDFFVKVKFHYF